MRIYLRNCAQPIEAEPSFLEETAKYPDAEINAALSRSPYSSGIPFKRVIGWDRGDGLETG